MRARVELRQRPLRRVLRRQVPRGVLRVRPRRAASSRKLRVTWRVSVLRRYGGSKLWVFGFRAPGAERPGHRPVCGWGGWHVAAPTGRLVARLHRFLFESGRLLRRGRFQSAPRCRHRLVCFVKPLFQKLASVLFTRHHAIFSQFVTACRVAAVSPPRRRRRASASS